MLKILSEGHLQGQGQVKRQRHGLTILLHVTILLQWSLFRIFRHRLRSVNSSGPKISKHVSKLKGNNFYTIFYVVSTGQCQAEVTKGHDVLTADVLTLCVWIFCYTCFRGNSGVETNGNSYFGIWPQLQVIVRSNGVKNGKSLQSIFLLKVHVGILFSFVSEFQWCDLFWCTMFRTVKNCYWNYDVMTCTLSGAIWWWKMDGWLEIWHVDLSHVGLQHIFRFLKISKSEAWSKLFLFLNFLVLTSQNCGKPR